MDSVRPDWRPALAVATAVLRLGERAAAGDARALADAAALAELLAEYAPE